MVDMTDDEKIRYILRLRDVKNMYLSAPPPVKTGNPSLDDFLDGGIKAYYKILFYGEAGVGKTRLLINTAAQIKDGSYKSVVITVEDVDPYNEFVVDTTNFKFLRVDHPDEVIDILDRILIDVTHQYRLIAIDRLDDIVRLHENPLERGFRILHLAGKIVYKYGASFVAASGVSQTPGETEHLVPRIPNQLITFFNRYYLLTKTNTGIRIYDPVARKAAVIESV